MGFGSIGMGELLVIFTVVLLLFGGKKLPELAKGIGKGMREFRKATREVQNEFSTIDRQIREEAASIEKKEPVGAAKKDTAGAGESKAS